MTIKENIQQILLKSFSPVKLEIIDESEKHKGHSGNPGGGETHFIINMISKDFRGKSKIEKHRMVQKELSNANINVHSISMKLLSDIE